MTTKRYILTYIILVLLMLMFLILFFLGLSFKEKNSSGFLILLICSLVDLVFTIIFLKVNYKKLNVYEQKRISEKIENIEFSSVDILINYDYCYNKLIAFGYRKNSNDILYKKVEIDCGDGSFFNEFFAKLVYVNEMVDINEYLMGFNKGLTTYNIVFLFIEKNIEENLEILKKYIKETIVDVDTYRYKYKSFFAPIIISNNKMYYLKAGSFISEYRIGVNEVIKIFEINE